MPSFKTIFSAIWYAWHWRNLGQVLFVFLGGLFFLFGAAYFASRDRLPNTPESIALKKAEQLIQTSTPHYVHLAASPDFSRRIFRTGAWAPFWGNCPPGDIHEIPAADMTMLDLNRLLGCAVTLSGRVDIGEARTIWWPDPGTSNETISVTLAPVKGSQERIWIRSPRWPGGWAWI